MCPECGGVNAGVVNTSHDPEGFKIRRRRCESCGADFNTVEVPFPFSFHEADEGKRNAPAYSSKITTPEYEPSWFDTQVGTVRLRRANRRRGAVEVIRAFDPDPDGLAMLITLRRSSKMPRCRKGLHVMRGANVYHHPRGHKVCNACRRTAANARYRRAA